MNHPAEINTAYLRRKRCLIYPLLAALLAVSQWVTTAPAHPTPKEWTIGIVAALLAAGNALKAYLDTTGHPK